MKDILRRKRRKVIALTLGLALAQLGAVWAADTGKTAAKPAAAAAAVDLNKADSKELMSLGFDEAAAKAIVDYRTKNGPFQKVEELGKVKGVTPEKLTGLKGKVTLN